MKTVYTAFYTDIIHEGHLSIVKIARKYGKVIIGALSDRALIKKNRFSTLCLKDRIELYRSLDGVDEVIVQDDVMYTDVINKFHPDYIIHADDWRIGEEIEIREHVINLLSSYGGELIEIEYIDNSSIQRVERKLHERLSMPEFRRKRLRQLLNTVPIVKVMEAHSGLTGLIVENTVVKQDGIINHFDAMWISSLCDSTFRGKPDIDIVDMSSRLQVIDEIMDITTRPIIFDGNSGGLTEHFVYHVRTLERVGVSAIIIEDKKGLKKNSLFGLNVVQVQENIKDFCRKIKAGKEVQLTDDFMIIARIESLILEKGMDDALKRAKAYVEAGADGIMIHSRKKEAEEIFEFCDKFRSENKKTPLVVVPSSFNATTEKELIEHGVSIVIYANQLTRAAFLSMKKTAEDILRFHRAKEVDERLLPIKEIITLIKEL